MKLRVLIACEFSGIVREAFRLRGHDAWSCDLLPTERAPSNKLSSIEMESQCIGGQLSKNSSCCFSVLSEIPGQHIQDDVLKHLDEGWDMMIAHPPCTYLTFAGLFLNNNNPQREKETIKSMKFVKTIMSSNVKKICIENPVGYLNTH